MPNYSYHCDECNEDTERVVPMAERNAQNCDDCQYRLTRRYTFTGTVWSPTATGGGHR